jgi:hypothetical protein
VVLADWGRIARDPGLAASFRHLVVIDPPPLPGLSRAIDRAPSGGFIHLAWGPPEVELAMRVWDAEWPSRPGLAVLYRELRAAERGEAAAIPEERLRELLSGEQARPRSPEVVGRGLRVLLELGVAAWEPVPGEGGSGTSRALRVVSSKGSDLSRSAAFVAYRERHEEGRQYLSRRRHQE